jgi:hypothetical protein
MSLYVKFEYWYERGRDKQMEWSELTTKVLAIPKTELSPMITVSWYLRTIVA